MSLLKAWRGERTSGRVSWRSVVCALVGLLTPWVVHFLLLPVSAPEPALDAYPSFEPSLHLPDITCPARKPSVRRVCKLYPWHQVVSPPACPFEPAPLLDLPWALALLPDLTTEEAESVWLRCGTWQDEPYLYAVDVGPDGALDTADDLDTACQPVRADGKLRYVDPYDPLVERWTNVTE